MTDHGLDLAVIGNGRVSTNGDSLSISDSGASVVRRMTVLSVE